MDISVPGCVKKCGVDAANLTFTSGSKRRQLLVSLNFKLCLDFDCSAMLSASHSVIVNSNNVLDGSKHR